MGRAGSYCFTIAKPLLSWICRGLSKYHIFQLANFCKAKLLHNSVSRLWFWGFISSANLSENQSKALEAYCKILSCLQIVNYSTFLGSYQTQLNSRRSFRDWFGEETNETLKQTIFSALITWKISVIVHNSGKYIDVLSAPPHKTFDIANLVTLLQYSLLKSARIWLVHAFLFRLRHVKYELI